MTATPQTGPSPLPVSFIAEGSDPEGGALSYHWTLGDDTASMTGPAVTHEYRRRGTHTARVTVTDPEGARRSAELE
jgi:cytochrome c